MKKIRVLLLVVFVLGLFQGNLFSIIFSKIEGVIKDKDSNQPIAGTEVMLFQFFHPTNFLHKVKTDNNGHFLINKIDATWGKFYLVCKKEKYIPNIPEYYINSVPGGIDLAKFEKLAGVFGLEAGESKYFDIKLEKGGSLRINFFKKTTAGTFKFPQTIHEEVPSVKILKATTPDSLINYEDGEVEIKEMEINYTKLEYLADDIEPYENYFIEIDLSDHVPRFVRNIAIKKNETTTVEYTFDFADKTGIMGIVRKNGQPIRNAFIDLYKKNEKEVIYHCSTWLKGDYSIILDVPGYYELEFAYKDENNNYIIKRKTVEIKKNETTILDIDF